MRFTSFGIDVEILRHLGAALRSAGRLGIVDFKTDGGGTGPAADERLDEATVIGDAERAGLRLIRKETFLPFLYLLVFGRASGPAEPVRRQSAGRIAAARHSLIRSGMMNG